MITISVTRTNSDVILILKQAVEDPAFQAYHLERRTDSMEWKALSAVGSWDEPPYMPITGSFHADTDVADGFYQYRVRLERDDESVSEWFESEWVMVGDVNVGWTFGNYQLPDGVFGDVLTPADIRETYLWGIEMRSSMNTRFNDQQIRYQIRSSVAEIERALQHTITRRKMTSYRDSENPPEGVEYEDPYPYRNDRWTRMGMLQLRRRPVVSVSKLELFTITDQKMMDLTNWMRVDHAKGMIRFFPRTGADGLMNVSPNFLRLGPQSMGSYAHGYRVEYEAGYRSSAGIPEDLRDIIGKVVACKLLNIIGDGLIAGFSSSSLSLDGVSESFSSTQSATNAYFGARIQVYLKDIDNYLKANRFKMGHMILGNL